MALINETAPTDLERRDCPYDLFRNKERPELLCAVPVDRPVPSFVVAEAWSFDRILQVEDAAPPGFHRRGARAGVRFNGYYLFYAVARNDQVGAPAVQNREEA